MRQFANDQPEQKEFIITVSRIDMESEKGFRITAPDGFRIWLPKSQVDRQQRLDGEGIDLVVPAWLYEAKEMDQHGL